MGRPSWASVILVALIVSITTSLTTQWASDTGRLDGLWQAPQSAPAPAPVVAPGNDARPVPQVIGLPRNTAAELLKARGLLLVVRERRPDPALPEGSIVAQDPLPDSELAQGSSVNVVLSAGAPAATTVPKVLGLTLADARNALESAKLQAGAVAGPAGGDERLVVACLPATGESVAPGSVVALTVGLPPVPVPKLVGLSLQRAKKAIEEAGLKVGKVKVRYDDNLDAFVVLSQTPEAGALAPAGSEVELVRNEE